MVALVIDVLLRAHKTDVQGTCIELKQPHSYAPRQRAKSCENFVAKGVCEGVVAVKVHKKAKYGTAEHVQRDCRVDCVEF